MTVFFTYNTFENLTTLTNNIVSFEQPGPDFYAPEGTSGGILKSHRPSVCPSVRLSEPTHGYILGRVLVEYLQFIPYRCP